MVASSEQRAVNRSVQAAPRQRSASSTTRSWVLSFGSASEALSYQFELVSVHHQTLELMPNKAGAAWQGQWRGLVLIVAGAEVAFLVEDGVVAALPRRHRNVPEWWCYSHFNRKGRQP